jgi:hypothetical protein
VATIVFPWKALFETPVLMKMYGPRCSVVEHYSTSTKVTGSIHDDGLNGFFFSIHLILPAVVRGTFWLRHYVTSLKVAGLRPDETN